mgnify:CR=1 FL=1
MFGHVPAEIRERREVHFLCYLHNGKVGIVEIFLYHRDGVTVDVIGDALARLPLYGIGEVFDGHVQLFGIISDFPVFLAASAFQQRHQFLHDIHAPVRGKYRSSVLGVEIEQVINQRKGQPAYQLAVKQMAGIGDAVADMVYVAHQRLRILPIRG